MICTTAIRKEPTAAVPMWYRNVRCCSSLQCVAVCCSVLQCVAVRCSVLQCFAVKALHNGYEKVANRRCAHVVSQCALLQCVAVCCSVLQRILCTTVIGKKPTVAVPVWYRNNNSCSVLQYGVLCCT